MNTDCIAPIMIIILIIGGVGVWFFAHAEDREPKYKYIPADDSVSEKNKRTHAMFVASYEKQIAQRGWASGGGIALSMMRSQMDNRLYECLMRSDLTFEQIDQRILDEH